MKRFLKWAVIPGAALVFATVCHGQTFPRAGPNPNLAPARTITGTVYDPSGAPAPGVLLLVVDPVNGPGLDIKSDASGKYAISWQSPRTTRSMVVDGMTVGGTPVDRFCTLVARDVAHNFATALEIGDTATNLDLRLQPGLAISFKVEDPTGKPVTNAAANLGTFFSGVGFMLIFNPPTCADDKGVIRMAGLPQGYDYTMNIRAPGYGSAATTTTEDQMQTTRLDLPPVVLKLANLKLAGQVLDADGKPTIARVSFIGTGQPSTNTVSDATGHFSFDVCEGTLDLFANWQDLTGRSQASGGDTNVVIRFADEKAVKAAANANAAAAARRTVTITGTVFDPSGAPAPGVEMSLMPRGQSQDSKSDAGGKFTVSWPPVMMWIGGARPVIQLLVGRDLEHNFAATASVDENTTNRDLHLKAGLVLSGSVQDHNGAAVNTATVRLTMTIPSTSSAVGAQPATVDEQGAFTFSALPQGRAYDLTVTAPGFAYTNVLVAATDTQTASLKLPPTRLKPKNKRLEGWVMGPDDKPVPGATVMVSGAGQAIASAHTDANGHFALMVCEGTVHLTAMVPNNQNNNGRLRPSSVQAQSGDLDVVLKLGVPARRPCPGSARQQPGSSKQPAAHRPLLTFPLVMRRFQNWALIAALVSGQACQGQDLLNDEPPVTISGTVRDPSGAPAAGVLITVHPGTYRGAPDYAEARSDASGRYDIILRPNETPQGEWGVSPRNCLLARDVERNLAATFEFIRTPTNVDLDLLPGITLSGLVKNANGAPVSNAWVDLRFQSDRAVFHLGPRPLATGAQGSFSIPALPQGHDYYFSDGITALGYDSASGLLAARNSQTNRYQFPAFVLKNADRKLAGRVVDPEGKPLAGATVSFYGLNQPLYSNSTRTDVQGNFAFNGVSDSPLRLTAGFVGPPGGGIVLNSVSGGMEVQPGATNIVLQLQEPSVRPPIPLPAIGKPGPAQTTAGTVCDPSGAPVPHVSLIVWRSQNQNATAHSDAAGKYAIRWQPMAEPVNSPHASATLIARDPAHNLAAAQDIDETSTNVPLLLRPGRVISGSLLDTDGAPVTNALVELRMQLNRMSGTLAEIPSDSRGLFSFNALPQVGNLYVGVRTAGYAVVQSVEASFVGVESNKLELAPIRLKPAKFEVAGTLIGPDDKPVPGMWISFSGAYQTGDIIFTDAEGHFDFKQVAEGNWALYVYKARINGAPPINGRIWGEGGDPEVVFKLPVPPPAVVARPAVVPGGPRQVPTNRPPPVGPLL